MKKLILITLASFNLLADFASEQAAGMNVTGGNTDLKAYNLKSQNKFEFEKGDVAFNGSYNYGESNESRSAENWATNLRYDRQLYHKLWGYLGQGVESDRFAGVARRYNSDIGLKYTFTKKDKNHFFAEVGYRYTDEKSSDNTVQDRTDSKGRVYSEYKNVFKKDMSFKLWVEYLPNFSESDDYMVSYEPSLSVALSSVFSLKTAYLWKYDNLPIPGNGKHDYQFTLSLIANI